jgi:hypothetical protein
MLPHVLPGKQHLQQVPRRVYLKHRSSSHGRSRLFSGFRACHVFISIAHAICEILYFGDEFFPKFGVHQTHQNRLARRNASNVQLS